MTQANKVINLEDVENAIKNGLMAYKDTAKFELRRRWDSLDVEKKKDAGRSLVSMETVAKDPKKYLSRENTEEAWFARAEEYAKEKDLPEVWYAFYIVQSPALLVLHSAEKALRQPLWSQYFTFLETIQQYEYADNDGSRNNYAESIIKESARICAVADINKSCCLVRGLKRALLDKDTQR